MIRKLTRDEIEDFAGRNGVRKIDIENFLMTVHDNPSVEAALLNLMLDAGMYHWNNATIYAIRAGIIKSSK